MAADARPKNPIVERGNFVVVAAMSAFWLSPVAQFWGAAFGPLRPFSYAPPTVEPSLLWVLVGLAACWVPFLLPAGYYQTGQTDRALRRYELLGIRQFKALATNGDVINRMARRREPAYRKIRGAEAVRAFGADTLTGERMHLVLLLIGLGTALFAARIGWYGWAVGLTVTNIIFNLYPVLLQRYNRARLARVRSRWEPR
jgi:Glycosyl-4,4'-diaponeurosporenoate acyltransferase